jgi:hypothetical protein
MTWKLQLGPDLENFTTLFLRARPGVADFVPCPWKCGCSHKVVPRSNGTLAGICQCTRADCDEYTVLPEERITWELDWPKIGKTLCRPFGLNFKMAKLGLYHTIQIGSWSRESIPAVFTIATSQSELMHTVTALVARLNRPFILLAPTAKHVGLAAQELLSTLGAIFIPLEKHLVPGPPSPDGQSGADGEGQGEGEFSVSQTSTPQLSTTQSPSTLFDDLAPQLPDAPDQDLAGRVCTVLDDLDSKSRRKHPSLAAVFKLYFVQDLPVAQVAKKCRCSVGTIANRLHLIQKKTGATPDQLRRIAPHFTDLHDSLADAKSDYFRGRKYDL